jgi:cellulose biosynthesis protein BcsQ
MSRQSMRPTTPDDDELAAASEPAMRKRVVFTKGGKGGVGKTGFMVNLAEWFLENEIPFTLLDLDTENKARGSLKHCFNGTAHKVNIHTEAGLDAFVDYPIGRRTALELSPIASGAPRSARSASS